MRKEDDPEFYKFGCGPVWRDVPVIDEDGKQALDEDGKPFFYRQEYIPPVFIGDVSEETRKSATKAFRDMF